MPTPAESDCQYNNSLRKWSTMARLDCRESENREENDRLSPREQAVEKWRNGKSLSVQVTLIALPRFQQVLTLVMKWMVVKTWLISIHQWNWSHQGWYAGYRCWWQNGRGIFNCHEGIWCDYRTWYTQIILMQLQSDSKGNTCNDFMQYLQWFHAIRALQQVSASVPV